MKPGKRYLTEKGLINLFRQNREKIRIGRKKYNKAEIYVSSNLKRKLVDKNPELAQNLYYYWRDYGETELGRLFAIRYNGHKEYGAAAFHIGQELGMPGIQRPRNEVVDIINNEEQRIYNRIRPENF